MTYGTIISQTDFQCREAMLDRVAGWVPFDRINYWWLVMRWRKNLPMVIFSLREHDSAFAWTLSPLTICCQWYEFPVSLPRVEVSFGNHIHACFRHAHRCSWGMRIGKAAGGRRHNKIGLKFVVQGVDWLISVFIWGFVAACASIPC